MAKRLFAIALLAWFYLVPLAATEASVPHVAIFFDNKLQTQAMDCPGQGVLDTLYVVAINWNCFVQGIEYGIEYPPQLLWLADVDTPDVTLGNSPTGLSAAWSLPQNGFFPIVIHKVIVLWQCDNCQSPDGPLRVVPHPLFGFVRVVQWPSFTFTNGIGLTGLVCPTVPTEETTWGGIKAMYDR